MTDSPAVNSVTGEPQSASGWSTDGGDAPPAAGASALKPQSALAQPDQTEIGKFEAGIAGAQKPYLDKIKSVLDSPQAAHAQLEKVKDEPNPQDYHKYSMEFASAAAVLGAVAGRFTRAGGTAALNAFSGALKGWQAGNLQAYEEASKQWEQATKKTLENNNIELEKYHEILNDKKANIEQMMAGLTIASSEYQNSVIYNLAKDGNFNGVAQAVDKMGQANQRLQGAYGQLTKLRSEDQASVSAKIDELNKDPALAQRLKQEKPTEWLTLKGTAHTLGLTLNEPPEGTQALPKVTTNPRSAPAMAVQQFVQEFTAKNGHPPSAEEITQFSAHYTGEVAYQRGAGNSAQRVENATNEVQQLIPQALETSKALPRGQFVPWNKLQQQWEAGTSDPAYYDFSLANFSLMNAYARAMNPQGVPRITERLEAHAAGVLSMATDQKSYEVQVARLWKEVQASKNAIAQTQKGRTGGDINAPLPGTEPAKDDGWGQVTVH